MSIILTVPLFSAKNDMACMRAKSSWQDLSETLTGYSILKGSRFYRRTFLLQVRVGQQDDTEQDPDIF